MTVRHIAPANTFLPFTTQRSFPQCLFFLEMLQKKEFRDLLINNSFIVSNSNYERPLNADPNTHTHICTLGFFFHCRSGCITSSTTSGASIGRKITSRVQKNIDKVKAYLLYT